MIAEPLILIALCIVFYGAYSQRLSNYGVSAPMVFMLTGLAAGEAGLGLFELDLDNHLLEGLGEITLGFILFADAAATNARRLRMDTQLPIRLLLIALPLTILFGALVAIQIFPNLSWQEAALIAAILAPTDAALGAAVITSQKVPERIRQAVLVESGLNDGLVLPIVLLFAALAFSGMDSEARGVDYWLQFAAEQILIGAAVGALIGAALGKLIIHADNQGWLAHNFRNLSSIGVAILILFVAHMLGGNAFVATFIGGLVFGGFCSKRAGLLTEFVEEEGQLFSLIIFFLFGAVLLPHALEFFTIFCVLYALLSLTVIRMAPTALSLIGARTSWSGKMFIGWFGPRGLASILFLLIAVENEGMGRLTEVEAVVYVTVFLSVILHGISAAPLSARYGRSAAAQGDG